METVERGTDRTQPRRPGLLVDDGAGGREPDVAGDTADAAWSGCPWAGLMVAALPLALRAPFIVVLLLAGATGALVHALAG